MPNEANQSKSTNYSLNLRNSRYVDCGTDLWDQLKTGNAISVSFWHKSDGGGDVFPFNFQPAFSGSSIQYRFTMNWSGGGGTAANNWYLRGTGIGNQVIAVQNKLPASGWNHYTLSLELGSDTSKQVFYLNGQQIGTTTTAVTSVDQGTNHLYLSQYYASTYTGCTGTYSSIAFFDYPLSQSQVTTLWSGGTEASNPMSLSPTPKAYYPLSESVWDGSNYIIANNAVEDYVFDFASSDSIDIVNSSTAPTSLQSLGNSNSYSISSWINTTTTDTYSALWFAGKTILEMRNEGTTGIHVPFNLSVSSGKLFFGRSSNYTTSSENYSSTTDVNTGSWVHCIATVDNNTLKFYINGSLDSTHTFTTATGDCSVGSNTSNFFIGSRSTDGGGNDAYFDGSLSNTQIFNTALSGPEVETLYNNGSPIRTLANIPKSSNLKAWYKLDASEIYNSSITDWEINNALSTYTSSLFVDNSISSPSYIKINNLNSTSGLSEYSFSAWVDLKSVNTAYGGLINGQYTSNWAFLANGSSGGSSWRWDLRTSSGTTQASVTAPLLNQGWCHIAGTYDGADMKFYKNGEEVFTGAKTGTMQTGSFEVDLGFLYATNDVNSGYSNFSIWNKGLTASEVNELYNSGNPGDLLSHSATSNLLNWWKLNNLTDGLNDLKGSFNAVVVSDVSDKPGSVSTLNGESTGMSQLNLVQSDLQTVAPYSKYAMSFDGNGYIDSGSVGNFTSSFTASCWINNWPSSGQEAVLGNTNGQNRGWILLAPHATNSNAFKAYINTTAGWYSSENLNGFSDNTKWVNLVVVYDSINNTLMLYSNTSEGVTATQPTGTLKTGADPLRIASEAGNNNFNGNISNVAIWNTALTASEVREIYNEGLPSNLHNFSGAAPVAWWKLGEGVSYDSTNLHVRDYIGSNHGVSSSSMDQSDIVNGVGTSNNGTGNGFNAPSSTITNIFSGPYSDKNAVSVDMQSAKTNSGIDTSTPQAT